MSSLDMTPKEKPSYETETIGLVPPVTQWFVSAKHEVRPVQMVSLVQLTDGTPLYLIGSDTLEYALDEVFETANLALEAALNDLNDQFTRLNDMREILVERRKVLLAEVQFQAGAKGE